MNMPIAGRVALVVLGIALVGAVAAAPAALLVTPLRGYIIHTTSDSVPGNWYALFPRPRTPRVGEVVLACAPAVAAREALRRSYIEHGPCPGHAEPLLKIIAAVGGDRVSVTAQGVRLRGRLLANSAPLRADSLKRVLSWSRARIVPAGDVWLTGVAPRSWDSRYWGPVPYSAVRARCIRLDGPSPRLDFQEDHPVGTAALHAMAGE